MASGAEARKDDTSNSSLTARVSALIETLSARRTADSGHEQKSSHARRPARSVSRSRSRSPPHTAARRTAGSPRPARQGGREMLRTHTGSLEEVNAFLQCNNVDAQAAAQLRACLPEKAAWVIGQGSVAQARNPSSVLMGRIREADRVLNSWEMAAKLGHAANTEAGAGPHEVERFIAANPVDPMAAARLRSAAPAIARIVLDRGPLGGARNPASVLLARIRDAETGRTGVQPGVGLPAPPPGSGADPEVERLIAKYRLDARAAASVRALTPEQQRSVAQLPLHEARNPSAFVMAQVGLRFGAGSRGHPA